MRFLIILCVSVCICPVVFAEDIEIKGDIDADDNSWEISFQAKATVTGGYCACFPVETSVVAGYCEDIGDLAPYDTDFLKSQKLECAYPTYAEALDKLVTGLHKLADNTESAYTVGFSSLSWTMYTREGSSSEGYTYTPVDIPADLSGSMSVAAGPSEASELGYEVNLDLNPSETQWEANVQVKMLDKVSVTDPDTGETKDETQYYLTFLKPSDENPEPQAAYCSGDFSEFAWIRQTGEDASKTFDDEFSCYFPTYAEAFEFGLKAMHAYGSALQSAGHLVKLSVAGYEMGTTYTVTHQKAHNTPLMTAYGSTESGNAPKGDSGDAEAVVVAGGFDLTGDGKLGVDDVVAALRKLTE